MIDNDKTSTFLDILSFISNVNFVLKRKPYCNDKILLQQQYHSAKRLMAGHQLLLSYLQIFNHLFQHLVKALVHYLHGRSYRLSGVDETKPFLKHHNVESYYFCLVSVRAQAEKHHIEKSTRISYSLARATKEYPRRTTD